MKAGGAWTGAGKIGGMKLEFLSRGSEDCPLVRLYDFTAAEVDRLFAMVSAIATGEIIDIHNIGTTQPP